MENYMLLVTSVYLMVEKIIIFNERTIFIISVILSYKNKMKIITFI